MVGFMRLVSKHIHTHANKYTHTHARTHTHTHYHSFLRLLKNPGLTTVVNGKNKSLYMPSIPSLEQATKPNLKKKLPGQNYVHGSVCKCGI